MTTDLPTPNIPLLRKAVEWAEAEALKPEAEREWNQCYYVQPADERSRWFETPCGTACCIAGYVGHITVGVSHDGDERVPDGRHVEAYAIEALGLTDDEAMALFAGSNTITDVRYVAESIAARAGESL